MGFAHTPLVIISILVIVTTILEMNREILENTGVLCYYESVIDRYDNWFVLVQRPTVKFIIVVAIVFDYSNEFLKERTKKKIEHKLSGEVN